MTDYSTASIEHVAREVSGLRQDISELVKVMRDQVSPALSSLVDRVARIETRIDASDRHGIDHDRQLAELRAEVDELRESLPRRRKKTTTKGKSARPKRRR